MTDAPLIDAAEIATLEERMAGEILARNADGSRLAVVGIRTRGVVLANRLRQRLERRLNAQIPFGALDITLYRDDLDRGPRPLVRGTEIEFDVAGKHVLLVDDVLYTGRTVRAALDEIIDFGRPATIQLAVLVDRGSRELPIQPDYVGKVVSVPTGAAVRVRLAEQDGRDEVVLFRR